MCSSDLRRLAGNGLRRFASSKLSIAETAKAIEGRILGITQVNGVQEFGTVISIGDGIARVVGLNKVQAG